MMRAIGWSPDRNSLGALIVALGLLVDDTIIAVGMMVVRIEQGWDRVRAAIYACSSTAPQLHSVPHADRHAGRGGRLHAGGLCEVDPL